MKEIPKIKDFYTFQSRLSPSIIQAHLFGLPKKEINDGLAREQKLIKGIYDIDLKFPLTFRQRHGIKLADILDTGWPSLYLISDNMKATFIKNFLTGWEIFQVKLLSSINTEIKGYNGLSITGRCGKVEYPKESIIEKSLIASGPLVSHYSGLHIGLDKWDKSNFFMAEDNFTIIIDSKTKSVLQKARFTNVKFINLAEIQTPIFND